ncbi:MAG: hypothetical protein ACLU80_04295 [Dorea sp.]
MTTTSSEGYDGQIFRFRSESEMTEVWKAGNFKHPAGDSGTWHDKRQETKHSTISIEGRTCWKLSTVTKTGASSDEGDRCASAELPSLHQCGNQDAVNAGTWHILT